MVNAKFTGESKPMLPDIKQQPISDAETTQEDMVRVVIHNDDVTPYEFVIVILQRVFQLTPLAAEHVTFVAHTHGAAHVGTYPLSEAQKRVGKAQFAAALEGFPLRFTIEPE